MDRSLILHICLSVTKFYKECWVLKKNNNQKCIINLWTGPSEGCIVCQIRSCPVTLYEHGMLAWLLACSLYEYIGLAQYGAVCEKKAGRKRVAQDSHLSANN
ncbi:hypothetical protein KIL84_017620 [Mauremys mutica]|uniref:Uncharacterized protein n=1 Tax=Mauremys mutica TaxID=74926 RepID=A0A9D3X5Q9_9SAUR|nr:hypothetical protein KIL84_017620 [Mauremys mutica]